MKIFLFLLAVVAVILAWRFYPVNSWDKTFPKSDNVTVKKVKFKNRYGIELVGDLYIPKNKVTENCRRLPFPALLVRLKSNHPVCMLKQWRREVLLLWLLIRLIRAKAADIRV